jgi:hypothetical protein
MARLDLAIHGNQLPNKTRMPGSRPGITLPCEQGRWVLRQSLLPGQNMARRQAFSLRLKGSMRMRFFVA